MENEDEDEEEDMEGRLGGPGGAHIAKFLQWQSCSVLSGGAHGAPVSVHACTAEPLKALHHAGRGSSPAAQHRNGALS